MEGNENNYSIELACCWIGRWRSLLSCKATRGTDITKTQEIQYRDGAFFVVWVNGDSNVERPTDLSAHLGDVGGRSLDLLALVQDAPMEAQLCTNIDHICIYMCVCVCQNIKSTEASGGKGEGRAGHTIK